MYKFLILFYMDIKKIIAAIFVFIIFFSCYFLYQLVRDEQHRIEPTSQPRFISLLIIHFLIIVYMFVCLKMETHEQYLRTALCLAFNITAIISMTEIYIFRKKQHFINLTFREIFSEPLELIYLNIYFLLYMLAGISSVVLLGCSIFVCYTRIQRENQMRQMLLRNVKQVPFSSELEGEDCPICLSPFTSNEPIVQIYCKHIFHEVCIKKWIKVNTTCPNCRYSLWNNQNQQDISEAINNEEVNI